MPSRRCGTRVLGGTYLVAEAGSSWLLDPPVPIAGTPLAELSPRGTHLIQRGGVWHIFDWIGADSYPTVPTFVEEAERMGVSRRIAGNTPWERLTDASRLILAHRWAVPNWASFEGALIPWMDRPCPQEGQRVLLGHAHEEWRLCLSHLWEVSNSASPGIFAVVPVTRIELVGGSVQFRAPRGTPWPYQRVTA
jgi:hypothetical protein